MKHRAIIDELRKPPSQILVSTLPWHMHLRAYVLLVVVFLGSLHVCILVLVSMSAGPTWNSFTFSCLLHVLAGECRDEVVRELLKASSATAPGHLYLQSVAGTGFSRVCTRGDFPRVRPLEKEFFRNVGISLPPQRDPSKTLHGNAFVAGYLTQCAAHVNEEYMVLTSASPVPHFFLNMSRSAAVCDSNLSTLWLP